MRVGVDIDDVLTDWFTAAHAIATTAGITNGNTPTSWRMWEDYGCTRAEWVRHVMDLAAPTMYAQLIPHPGARQALDDLRAAGHTVHIVTARGFGYHAGTVRHHTARWLDVHHLGHDSLTFSRDKTIVHTDVFVDDSWDNVNALNMAGVKAYLHTAPHNDQIDYDLRVPNLAAFAKLILEGNAA